MALPRVIPVLLLQHKGFVKTIRFQKPVYIGDPVNSVKIFNDKEADELIIMDIAASAEKREPDYEYLQEIASECFMPLSYAGGVTTLHHIQKLIQCGIEKIVINSAFLQNPEFLKDAAGAFGSSSIVAAMDIKKNLLGKYKVYDHVKKRSTDLNPAEYAKSLQNLGAGELFLNNVDRDGTREGYDIKLIRHIASSVSMPVIACGGCSDLNDIKTVLSEAHASAAAAGSLFVFHGPHRAVLLSYPSGSDLIRKA
jgi:imidazole glycerol-phosphate synthase subunit HisF